MAGGKKTLNNNKSRSRRRNPGSSSGALFVEGGVLSDWPDRFSPQGGRRNSSGNDKHNKTGRGNPDQSKASGSIGGSQKDYRNAIRYEYPTISVQEGLCTDSCFAGTGGDNEFNESNPIVLVDYKETPIVAYIDKTPLKDNQHVDYMYEYSSGLTLEDSCHRGLGFSVVSESNSDTVEPSGKRNKEERPYFFSPSLEREKNADDSFDSGVGANLEENMAVQMISPQESSGFLSIGGMKLYTQDIMDQEDNEDEDGESMDEEDTVSSEPSSDSDSSEDMSDNSSDIEDDIAEDYIKGIGGSCNIQVIDVNKILENQHDILDDNGSSGSGIDETVEKLGGIALQEASRQYGMKKPWSRKKNMKSGGYTDNWSPCFDDLMLVKDPRAYSARRKDTVGFCKSFPSDGPNRKSSRSYPGEKKKHRKEMIALKRRERMMRRGVDLEQINLELEQMVLNGVDILSFQPMHPRDCSQVRRVAAIYGLRSGCQGSGKKRFVTVTRAVHTRMPSPNDKLRLEKLIGAGEDDEVVHRSANIKTKKTPKESGLSLASRSRRNEAVEKKQAGSKGPSFANQPVSFVSSGILQSEPTEISVVDEHKEANDSTGETSAVASFSYAAFEVHTTGFGSRMMAKMGFEGGGLGKDGKGMTEPIAVIQRPKSLGLGVDFSETSPNDFKKSSESQGKARPIAGTRRPKSQGQVSKTGVDKGKREIQSLGAFEKYTKGFGSKMMAKMGFVEGSGLGRDSQGMVSPLVAVRCPRARGLGATG